MILAVEIRGLMWRGAATVLPPQVASNETHKTRPGPLGCGANLCQRIYSSRHTGCR